MSMNEQPTEPWHGDQLGPGDVHSQQQDTPSPATQKSARRVGGLSRRKLFIGLAGVGTAAAVGGGVALEQWVQHGGLKPTLQGPLSTNVQIGHLLRRAGFGGTPQEISSYAALGYDQAVDRLINYQQVSDDAMEQRLKSLNLDFTKLQDQQRWWLLRMAWTQRPLLEKMTLFWSGHFTSSFQDVGKARDRMITQNQFLRSHAFDTFDNLLLGITADPAMLVYLNLTQSRKKVPNENYARELMELFTLGLGHYTQQDVYEAAAALTGWHVVGQTTTSEYLENTHNNQIKTYLGHMGDLDYKDVINILANHPATPWFICRKLFTFFAYENPSDDDLKPLVNAYVKSNHNMGEVIKTLLLSPQFTSDKAYRSRIKSPTEFVVGAYRALNIQGNGTGLPAAMTSMGQTLFDPPNVAGWPGDKNSSLWLNSGTWMARLNLINQLLLRGGGHAGAYQPLDLQGIVNQNHIDSPEHFVDYFTSFLLDGKLDQDRKAPLVDYFTTNDNAKKRVRRITLTNGKSYPINRVRGALYLLMGLPEYQLN
jgi:hypothetical protein